MMTFLIWKPEECKFKKVLSKTMQKEEVNFFVYLTKKEIESQIFSWRTKSTLLPTFISTKYIRSFKRRRSKRNWSLDSWLKCWRRRFAYRGRKTRTQTNRRTLQKETSDTIWPIGKGILILLSWKLSIIMNNKFSHVTAFFRNIINHYR